MDVFCYEILKGPESSVRFSKSSTYTSSDSTELTLQYSTMLHNMISYA